MAEAEKRCPVCGSLMLDKGIIQDYYDDYSPYLDMDIYEDGYKHYDDFYCIHLFSCPECHYDTRLAFRRIDEARLMD